MITGHRVRGRARMQWANRIRALTSVCARTLKALSSKRRSERAECSWDAANNEKSKMERHSDWSESSQRMKKIATPTNVIIKNTHFTVENKEVGDGAVCFKHSHSQVSSSWLTPGPTPQWQTQMETLSLK